VIVFKISIERLTGVSEG